jgi:hypothetical protein
VSIAFTILLILFFGESAGLRDCVVEGLSQKKLSRVVEGLSQKKLSRVVEGLSQGKLSRGDGVLGFWDHNDKLWQSEKNVSRVYRAVAVQENVAV